MNGSWARCGERGWCLLNQFLAIRIRGSPPVAATPEKRAFLLFIKPAKELLKSGIGQDLFHRVKYVPQFIMRPGFVDKILARMAGGDDFLSAFAPGHNVMPARGHHSFTKDTTLLNHLVCQPMTVSAILELA
jgi:hypothetical protein